MSLHDQILRMLSKQDSQASKVVQPLELLSKLKSWKNVSGLVDEGICGVTLNGVKGSFECVALMFGTDLSQAAVSTVEFFGFNMNGCCSSSLYFGLLKTFLVQLK